MLDRRRSQAVNNVNQPFPDHIRIDLEAYDTVITFDVEINDLLLHATPAVNVFRGGAVTDITSKLEHRFYRYDWHFLSLMSHLTGFL